MWNLSNNDIWYAFGLSAIFLCGFISFSALYALIVAPLRRRRRLRQRVASEGRQELIQTKLFKTRQVDHSLIMKILQKAGAQARIDRLQRELLQADIYKDVAIFLGVVLLMASVGFIMGALWGSFLLGFLMAGGLGYIPFLYLAIKKRGKSVLVEKQMPEVMELLARSMRAGHTLSSAMELASKETPHPLGTELRVAYEEQRLGVSMAEALEHMVARIASRDFRYFVTAVIIQAETGGNLAEIMEKIGYLIRERLKLKGKIRTLTAEGRLSAIILGGLPFVIAGVLFIIQPKYIKTLFIDPIGQKMVIFGLVAMTLGIISMKKIIKIKI
jgi:tight adherence protein B